MSNLPNEPLQPDQRRPAAPRPRRRPATPPQPPRVPRLDPRGCRCDTGTELLVSVRGRGAYHPYLAGARGAEPYPPPSGSSYELRVHAALECARLSP